MQIMILTTHDTLQLLGLLVYFGAQKTQLEDVSILVKYSCYMMRKNQKNNHLKPIKKTQKI